MQMNTLPGQGEPPLLVRGMEALQAALAAVNKAEKPRRSRFAGKVVGLGSMRQHRRTRRGKPDGFKAVQALRAIPWPVWKDYQHPEKQTRLYKREGGPQS